MKYNKEADLQLQLFDNIEIHNIIDNLENKTSYGVDGISTSLLRSIKSVIIKLLNCLNNQMLRTCFFRIYRISELIQIANILKGRQYTFVNFSSILPSLSKIFE